MIEFIFVSLICVGPKCDFVVSNQPVTQEKCMKFKEEFLQVAAQPNVTFAATQCVPTKQKDMI